MLNKIPFDSALWDQLRTGSVRLEPDTQTLLRRFTEKPDEELFLELNDRIFDSNTCLPQFYLALPYLIELADTAVFETAADLWAQIGGWLSEGIQDHSKIPECVLTVYREWLDIGIEKCIRFICKSDLSGFGDLPYLLSAPLGMTNPAFAYISTSNVKFDIGYDTEFEISCPLGHKRGYILRDSEVANSQGKTGRPCSPARLERMSSEVISAKRNPWKLFGNKLKGSPDHQPYFRMAEVLCNKGITENTPLALTIIFYGCLLECFGQDEDELARRCFHMTDEIECPECGELFCLADGWDDCSWLLGNSPTN